MIIAWQSLSRGLPATAHEEGSPEVGAVELIGGLPSVCLIAYSSQKPAFLLLCGGGTWSHSSDSERHATLWRSFVARSALTPLLCPTAPETPAVLLAAHSRIVPETPGNFRIQ